MMKILIIGTTGAIGSKVKEALSARHEVISAGRNSGDIQVDLTDAVSIENMYKSTPGIDAVIVTAGYMSKCYADIADFTFSR